MTNPYFIENIQSLIEEAREIPTWGTPISFPWSEFSKEFGSFLKEEVQIKPGLAEWKNKDLFLSGLGEKPLQIAIETMPLGEKSYFLISVEDLVKLSSSLITSSEKQPGFTSPDLQKGFLRFFALKVIQILEKISFVNDLSFKVVDATLSDIQQAYSIDISLNIDSSSVWGRLLLPDSFQKKCKKHYINKPLPLSPKQKNKWQIPLALEVGKTSIHLEELQSLTNGDFLLLDHCSYNPETKKGTQQLTFQTTPIFQTKLKEGGIKILDYANYHEATMVDEFDSEEELDDDDDSLFSTDEEEEELKEEETASQPSSEVKAEEIVSPQKVSQTIHVEMAKISMTMDKLLALTPGNVLELGIHPEEHVYLTLNGKRIGRGELMLVGDTIGVKILEIGT